METMEMKVSVKQKLRLNKTINRRNRENEPKPKLGKLIVT